VPKKFTIKWLRDSTLNVPSGDNHFYYSFSYIVFAVALSVHGFATKATNVNSSELRQRLTATAGRNASVGVQSLDTRALAMMFWLNWSPKLAIWLRNQIQEGRISCYSWLRGLAVNRLSNDNTDRQDQERRRLEKRP
jgi:hypothetical protein